MQPNPISVAPWNLESAAYPAMLVRFGVVQRASSPAVSIFGSDLIGRRLLDLVADSDRPAAAGYLESRVIGPPARMSLRANDGWWPVEVTWTPVDDDGPATVVTWRNVEREEQVQAWLSAVTDSSGDLIGITDTRGELLYMNDALLRLRGETSRSSLPDGRNAIDHAAPGQSEIVEHLLEQLSSTGRWRGQLMFQGVDGLVPVDAVIERSEVGGRTMYSLIGRDVSEELELRTGLIEAMEERARFVAHVAHEIKNPLSAVEGMAFALRDETDLTPAQREMLELMTAGAADIHRVVEDLAGFVSGVPTPEHIASDLVELAPLARTVVDTIEAAHGVSIRLSGSAACVGDELRIRQILRNLLTNAVRYGGPDVRVDLRRDGGRVLVEVSDDGDGVPSEWAESIFESFSSAHNTVEGSMGVGLAVSRRLAIGMGGSLSYDRNSGRTRFTVDLAAA
jgi:PAS domain S-box-containing protein